MSLFLLRVTEVTAESSLINKTAETIRLSPPLIKLIISHMTTLQLLKKLISIDSQGTKGNKEIVDFIASQFPKELCKVTPIKKGDLDLYNLEIKIAGQSSDEPIIFSGHTDTVPISNKWTIDPFGPIEKDGKVYGLGSSDMKAGLACMIQAAKSIKEKPKQDIIFLFDADEESGCAGGKEFMQRLSFFNAKIVICEPTGSDLEIGQKGVIEIKVKFVGQASHSSRTSFKKNLENNAIHKAFQAFKKLEEYELNLEKNEDELFGFPTQAVCLIQGGSASNVIPDQCSFVINRRVLPSENIESVGQEIINLLAKVDPQVQVKISFLGESNLLNKESDLFNQTKKISKEVLGNYNLKVTPGWTQAGLFKQWGDCLIWGPGNLDKAHMADEYCEISLLDKMVECYEKLITENQ